MTTEIVGIDTQTAAAKGHTDMTLGNSCAAFNADEIAELQAIAKSYREAGGLIVMLSNLLGDKIDGAMRKVPQGVQATLAHASDIALRSSYEIAAVTQAEVQSESYLNRILEKCAGERWHRIASSISGAVGGAGGLATFAADLGVTTTLVLRSIQQIALSYDEDIADEEVRLQCLAVFGLGGPLTEDDDVETGLFSARIALRGKSLEAVLRVIVPRFLPNVGTKAITEAVPFVGAAVGAVLNPAFTTYYQKMAHIHFRLRRIERQHDPEQVRACFERIVADVRQQARQPRFASR